MKSLIEQATNFLKGKILHTPIEFSAELSRRLGVPTYLKLESLQVTGSFKVRGAFFYLSTLTEEEKKRGVSACSAGNHGLGVAYAANTWGVPCTVYVPNNVDQAKYNKLISLGAKVQISQWMGYDDTLVWATEAAAQAHLPLISAFNDEKIMAGNGGTLAVEILEDLPEITQVILPMGGGGLAAGASWYITSKHPKRCITVCQLAACPAFQLSLEQGQPLTYMPPIATLAGGLEGGLGDKCFHILKTRVDEVIAIQEAELQSALAWALEQHQYLIEPSAAVSLAAALFGHVHPKGPVVIVLTGRNVSYATLKQIVCVNECKSLGFSKTDAADLDA